MIKSLTPLVASCALVACGSDDAAPSRERSRESSTKTTATASPASTASAAGPALVPSASSPAGPVVASAPLPSSASASSAEPAAQSAGARVLTAAELAEVTKALAKFDVDPKQSFRLTLNGFGECSFASTTFRENSVGDYLLVANGKAAYTFPQFPGAGGWARQSVLAVWFGKLDGDDLLDVVAIAEAMTGMGSTGAVPFPVVTYYKATGPKTFALDKALSEKATDAKVKTIAAALKLAGK
jgi:hypothetical protein